jgi:hypothetical protein
MATILSSGTETMNSVIICCTTVVPHIVGRLTVYNCSPNGLTCFLLLLGAGTLDFSDAGGSATGTWRASGRCCAMLHLSAPAKETLVVVRFEENSVVILDVLYDCLFCNSSAYLQPQ